jgi:hypothetical protein
MKLTSQIRSATCVTLIFCSANTWLKLTLRPLKQIRSQGHGDRGVVEGVRQIRQTPVDYGNQVGSRIALLGTGR